MGLPRLNAAAVWTLGALVHLQRAGRPARRNAWDWVDVRGDHIERCQRIQSDDEPPANRCSLVTVRMPVESKEKPQPGGWIAASYDERQLWAADNRRLVGSVARALIDYIDLQQQAAIQHRAKAQSREPGDAAEKAEQFALEVRERAQAALRGVDLQALDRAVGIEISAEGSGSSSAKRPPAEVRSSDRSSEPELEVDFVDDKLVTVREGPFVAEIRGSRRVWVFQQVWEAGGDSVSWEDLVKADFARAYGGLSTGVDATNRRYAMKPSSFQRQGNHIKRDLGSLAYRWHQDGRGARWAS